MSETSSQVQQMTELFQRQITESMGRMSAGFEELAKMEHQATEHARTALTDLARVSQEGLNQATALSAEWRKLSLEAFHKGAALFMPRS
jgi:hypothetical protein